MELKLSFILILCLFAKLGTSSTLSEVNTNLNLVMLETLSTFPDKKAVCAPYSIMKGLGLLYEGMGDSSRSKVSVGFPGNHETFLKMFKTEASFSSPSKMGENMIILDDKREVNYAYAAELNSSMNAIAFRANITSEPDKALNFINKRVAKRTRDKIVKFLAPGSITPDTNLILINVLYFNSKWRKEFNKNVESKTLFKLQNNPRNTIKADYMFGELSARYFRTPLDTEIVSLPFEDENYSMVFVIPQNDIKSFMKTELKTSPIMKMVLNPDLMEEKVLSLWMPKFSITTKLALKSSLSQRPETAEFFSGQADYSRMAKERVQVDEVHHMATMDVTPGGVEAAAATGITITLYSAFIPDVEVKVDRPFLFFIVEKPTNMILFSGFVNDPRN